MELYSELVIDLYKNPLNKRVMPDATISHSGAIISCGDRVRVYAKVNKKGVIEDAAFEGEGCAISIAAASLLTEELKGKILNEVTNWGPEKISEWLGMELGPARIKCGMLALESLQKGIKL